MHLDAESEWRFELESDENIAVRVSRGDFILPSSSHTTYPVSLSSRRGLVAKQDFTPLPYMITFIAFQCEAKSSHLSHSTPTHMTDVTTQIQTPDPVYINSEELPPVTWYPLLRHLKSALYAPTPAKIEGRPVKDDSDQSVESARLAIHVELDDTTRPDLFAPCLGTFENPRQEVSISWAPSDGSRPALLGKDDGGEESHQHGSFIRIRMDPWSDRSGPYEREWRSYAADLSPPTLSRDHCPCRLPPTRCPPIISPNLSGLLRLPSQQTH